MNKTQIKRMLLYTKKLGKPYFMVNKNRWYLEDISTDGYNLTMFTNCGYFGKYKLISFENGINDYAILEEVE